ncbi:hypothetical protein G4B88_005573 [Cannabis sativa]|uniref:Uncharacterized protein n=1 Tax=Cannabis sativa TaxID=3483 RepID=A0A7J6H8S5_CANSA|nr:hypothetical protein G4B88_005573 [Cannabis sativa]
MSSKLSIVQLGQNHLKTSTCFCKGSQSLSSSSSSNRRRRGKEVGRKAENRLKRMENKPTCLRILPIVDWWSVSNKEKKRDRTPSGACCTTWVPPNWTPGDITTLDMEDQDMDMIDTIPTWTPIMNYLLAGQLPSDINEERKLILKKSKKEEPIKEIVETLPNIEVKIPYLEEIKEEPPCANILKKLCPNELKLNGETQVLIQLTNQTNAYSLGIVKDIFVEANGLVTPNILT